MPWVPAAPNVWQRPHWSLKTLLAFHRVARRGLPGRLSDRSRQEHGAERDQKRQSASLAHGRAFQNRDDSGPYTGVHWREMHLSRVSFGATAAVLVLAAPAAALTGAGTSSALHSGRAVTINVTQSRGSNQTCQAEKHGRTSESNPVLGNGRKIAVVACEQPPRSEFVTPNMLKQATATALATIG